METKPGEAPQAPAQGTDPEKEVKLESTPTKAGLDQFTTAQLRDFYAKSPQMFEEAGIVKKPEVKPPEPGKLMVGDTEIKLPEDFQVDKALVEGYIAHAKEIGLNPKQVQAEIDFQFKRAREAAATQPKPKTPVELQAEADAVNVGKLKQEFGTKYDENMDIARRAAGKYGDADLLSRLNTSDPVLVKHFLKIGKADAEDSTTRAPNRNGNETADAEQDQSEYYKKRFPNTPSMHPKTA